MGTVRYTVIDGEIIAEKRNGVRKQYVPDSLGSTVALLDNTQTPTDTFSYWPYGEVASRTGTTPTPFQYVGTLGCRQDSASKTYMRARVLDTPTGRWLTEDLSGFYGGNTNMYVYSTANPSSLVDYSGLEQISTQKIKFPPGYPPYIDGRYNCMAFAFDRCIWTQPPLGGLLGSNGLPSCALILAYARTLGLVNMINGKCKENYHPVALFATGPGGIGPHGDPDFHWYRQWSDGHWSSKHGHLLPVDTGHDSKGILDKYSKVKHDAHCENYTQDCGKFCVPDGKKRPYSPPRNIIN